MNPVAAGSQTGEGLTIPCAKEQHHDHVPHRDRDRDGPRESVDRPGPDRWRRRLRRGARRDAGRHRSPAGRHRAAGRRRRRGAIWALPARPGCRWRCAAAGTAAPATARPTTAWCIDLRDMTAIDIDVDGRTAWAEAGAHRGRVHHRGRRARSGGRLRRHRVGGLGGITLGGGVGYLARKHGLTIDSLLAADMVTADGEVLRVDADIAPGAVLGDPRRRRQLRRGHPLPVPAARGATRSSAGCWCCPPRPRPWPASSPRPRRRRTS